MIYLNAFLVCGLICALGQLIMDLFHKTPAHITGYYVILGAALEMFGLYDILIDFAGGGALVPITSFGHSLAHAAFLSIEKNMGLVGFGMFDLTASGITMAIVFAFIMALIFKPKG